MFRLQDLHLATEAALPDSADVLRFITQLAEEVSHFPVLFQKIHQSLDNGIANQHTSTSVRTELLYQLSRYATV